MGAMYAWATPDYLLDHMSIEQVFYFYDQGIKCRREAADEQAIIILNRTAEMLTGKKQQSKKGPGSDKPDKAAFYKHYADQIERPEQKGGD